MHLLTNPIRSDALLEKTLEVSHRFYASSSEPLLHRELIELARENGDHDLIEMYEDHSLGYSESGGSLDLREEISKLYDAGIQADNIVIFPGAQTAMTLCAHALLHEGDHAIVITPSYQSLEEGVKLAGCELTRVALSPENAWEIDLAAVEAAINSNTRYIVLNDPHNPSGALMSEQSKKECVALAEAHDILVFSDEVYRLLEIDPSKRSASICELSAKGIALGTMAKPWGAGGICIGWLACQDKKIIEKFRKAQHLYAVCFSRAAEIQAMMVLRSSQKIIDKNLKIIRENLILLEQYFAENSDLFEWLAPKAGGVAFVKFKGPLSANELAEQLLEEGILVFPPSVFDCEEDLKQYFRIGFSRRTMPASLEAFKDFVNKHKPSWQLENR